MSSLKDRIGKEPLRAKVIADCVTLIDAQVKNKGFMIKAAYATIKTIKRRFVPEVVDGLLDEWLDKIQPHFDKWEATKSTALADSRRSKSRSALTFSSRASNHARSTGRVGTVLGPEFTA